jgi:hypothetical protein
MLRGETRGLRGEKLANLEQKKRWEKLRGEMNEKYEKLRGELNDKYALLRGEINEKEAMRAAEADRHILELLTQRARVVLESRIETQVAGLPSSSSPLP